MGTKGSSFARSLGGNHLIGDMVKALGSVKTLCDIAVTTWSGSDVIGTMTARCGIFLFCYSPSLRALVSWSDNAETVLGVKDTSIARDGNLFLRHAHPDDRFPLLSELERALNGAGEYRATYRWIRPDTNEVRWLHCRGALRVPEISQSSAAANSQQEPVFEGAIVDLSSEFTGVVGRLAGPDSVGTLLASFPTMVWTMDRDLRLLRISRPATAQRFNFGDPGFRGEELRIGRPFLVGFSDDAQRQSFEQIFQEVLGGRAANHRSRVVDGLSVFTLEVVPLTERDAVHGLLCVVSDVSEVVELEQQVATLQRAEGLRLLAAGISHNFNNSLQSIVGHASAMLNHPEREEIIRSSSQAIIDIVNRASQLSQQLFTEEQSGGAVRTPTDLNATAMAAVNRITDLFSSGLKVTVAFGNPPRVLAHQPKLVEAIEAIIRNAKEASSEGGSLSIKSYQVQLTHHEVQDLPAGTYAKLTVTDTGRGMESTTKLHCLEPFSTTKEADPETGVSLTGKGLGLSKVFATVRELKGGIRVESTPGAGSSIALYLPAEPGSGERVGERTTSPPRDQVSLPSILLIDDDQMVLQTVAAILTDAGYRCATAEDSATALALIREHARHLRLVIVDAIMPGADGAAVVRQIRRLHPGLPVLGFSGAAPTDTRSLLDAGAVEVLRKPLDPRALRAAAERVMLGEVARVA